MQFKYRPISRKYNFGGHRSKGAIKFIAIHWTANTSAGANGDAHYRYFNNNNVGASAHYFVDSKGITQIVGDSTVAYAVGGNQGYGTGLNGCTNYNSISIEMCVNKDGDFNKTLELTIELVKELKTKYPKARICRHWDCTRKDCPSGFTGRNNAKWNKFLADTKKPKKFKINIEKDSEITMRNASNKKQCVMYYKDANEHTARVISYIKRIPCFKDNGKDLPKKEYSKWDILYVGDLGKDRQDTCKKALNKYLGTNFK